MALAFLNTIVKPILMILTIPITLVTLGLFLLVINAVIILFASKMVNGFYINDFISAAFFSLVLSVCTAILNMLFGVNREEE